MNRTSSTGELARVGAVLTALFARADREPQEHWGQTVVRTIAAAVSAANAVLVVGFKHGAQLYGAGIEEELNGAYAQPNGPEPSVLFRHPHTGVWCRRAVGLDDSPERMYDGVPVPEGTYDAVGLTVDIGLPGARATISCHHRPAQLGEDVREQTKVLEMLQPAITAGVQARMGTGREQTALTRLVDALREGAALCSSDGTVLHQNTSLARMMAEDPERGRLWRALSTAAREAAAQAAARADGADRPTLLIPDTRQELEQELRTAGGRHRLRAKVLSPAAGLMPGLVAVIVERLASEAPVTHALRKRFGLTERELDVTKLLSAGKSNADIARALGISPYTARHHTESVLFKLGARSRAEVPRLVLDSAAHGNGNGVDRAD